MELAGQQQLAGKGTRAGLNWWEPDLADPVGLFKDGFESKSTSVRWHAVI
eukprot:SAG31_NODE_10343_length_1152_cov_1.486230_1_plen_49_part_10